MNKIVNLLGIEKITRLSINLQFQLKKENKTDQVDTRLKNTNTTEKQLKQRPEEKKI